MIHEEEAIKSGILKVAELMVIAAKTAPKARGLDNIETIVIADKEELNKLALKMEELAKYYGDFFARDAVSVRNSDAIVIIGAKVINYNIVTPPRFKTDVDIVLTLLNLGIAIGSAVKIASIMNVDNRVMYSVGLAAQEMQLIKADFAIGIPLSAKSKNIYFDRKWK